MICTSHMGETTQFIAIDIPFFNAKIISEALSSFSPQTKKKRKKTYLLFQRKKNLTLFTLNVKMKLTTLFICLLYALGTVIDAHPTHQNNTIETDASLQIAKWDKQYHQYIKATIKTRKSGCTSNNIVYLQEWYNLIFSCIGFWGGGEQTEAPKFY